METMETQSVEMQEVAEPVEEYASGEIQEVAEPVEESTSVEEPITNGRTEQDSAFAELRRNNQRLEEENRLMIEALERYFQGDDATELSIQANAYADNRDPEEVRAEFERAQEFASLQARNEELEQKIRDVEIARQMQEDLRTLQEIDPSIESFDDMSLTFWNYMSAGCDVKTAYYASMVQDQKEKVYAPTPIGRVQDTQPNRDYYTKEEIDNLSTEEIKENWDKVMYSYKMMSK